MNSSDCGFVKLKLHTGGKTYINSRWIVEIQPVDQANPEKGSRVVLAVQKDGEPVELQIKQSVSGIWDLIGVIGARHHDPSLSN